MFNIEYAFIFAVLIFYGFIFLLYTTNGNSLYGLDMDQITFEEPPEPTGNILIDFLNAAGDFVSTIVGFFTLLFITPFTTGDFWAVFGFINWAIFGSMVYLFIRVIRGGG